jgi:hypothetical protein
MTMFLGPQNFDVRPVVTTLTTANWTSRHIFPVRQNRQHSCRALLPLFLAKSIDSRQTQAF